MKLFTKDNQGTSFIKSGSDRNVCMSRLIKIKDVFCFQILFRYNDWIPTWYKNGTIPSNSVIESLCQKLGAWAKISLLIHARVFVSYHDIGNNTDSTIIC